MKKHPFKISLWFGIPMVLVGIVLLFTNPLAESNLVAGFVTPVVAFEFIQSFDEVAQFFQVENVNTYRNDMSLGNNIDFLFMFFYSVFLGFTGFGILKVTKTKALAFPIALSAVVFLGDLMENMTMASIISSYFEHQSIPQSLFGNLKFFTWLKWGSIATVLLIYAAYFAQQQKLGKAIAFFCMANFVAAIVAFFFRGTANEVMGATTLMSFVLILVHNIRFKVR